MAMAMATGSCCGLIWSGFLGGSGLQQQQLWASVRATPPKRPSPASGFLTVEATKSTRREDRTARHARIRKKVSLSPHFLFYMFMWCDYFETQIDKLDNF